MARQIVLDTETTGLVPDAGHRIIEVGAVELVDRKLTGRHFHKYVNPERAVDDGALEVHGITNDFLADKPTFDLVADEFLAFVHGAELVIHNAPFDVSFLNYELRLLGGRPQIESICSITDSLYLARQKHPGQKNSLDALCRRYQVDNSQRDLHGALLDAEILADVYLLMTGGQTQLFAGLQSEESEADEAQSPIAMDALLKELKVVQATAEELTTHNEYLEFMSTQGATPLWRELYTADKANDE